MTIKQEQYETLLATCSEYSGAFALLKQYRPYLSAIPSVRRPEESIVTIPLPAIRVRHPIQPAGHANIHLSAGESVLLPCDVALLMCDPEWKIKTGVELLVFIHRPDEDFSNLLMRWRQVQILLDRGYEWLFPARYQHLVGNEAEVVRPLFVVFPQSPARILKGLKGAGLPVVVQTSEAEGSEAGELAAPEFSAIADSDELDLDAAESFNLSDLDDTATPESPLE